MFYTLSFEREKHNEFCNWKTILSKTNVGKHLYRNLFLYEVTH